ncbi:MAG: HNH endonuclease signature motif containing protein, partial [Chloroflexota bacterium]
GRVAHRCECAEPDSKLRRFLALAGIEYTPMLRETPYKRGVPPQIKRRERAIAKRNHNAWYAALVAQYGEVCLHCGATDHLKIDHVVSVARGGKSEYENVQLLCGTCNTAKGKLVYDCRPTE